MTPLKGDQGNATGGMPSRPSGYECIRRAIRTHSYEGGSMSDNLKKDDGEKGRGMRLASKESILSEEIRTPRPCSCEITPKLNENLLRRDFFT